MNIRTQMLLVVIGITTGLTVGYFIVNANYTPRSMINANIKAVPSTPVGCIIDQDGNASGPRCEEWMKK